MTDEQFKDLRNRLEHIGSTQSNIYGAVFAILLANCIIAGIVITLLAMRL